MAEMQSKQDRIVASMVLGGVGDALGYKNGNWEFCHSGENIQAEVAEMGGLENIEVKPPTFILSDDTIMCIATAEALVSKYETNEQLFAAIAAAYKSCMDDMSGRAPGNQTLAATYLLKPDSPNGWIIPFCPSGGGCGAAMRATPIGLLYHKPDQLDQLVTVSIESGRMTHNHPVGYLGSLATALFTALAMQGLQIEIWGRKLMETETLAWKYIQQTGQDLEKHEKAWAYFWDQWRNYLTPRGLLPENGVEPVFVPRSQETVEERDAFYKSLSYSGWGGSSGHDAPMIAYDALLHAKDNWKELCYRAAFHSGDSDSTAILALSWFGVLYGMDSVPVKNHEHLEYRDRLVDLAKALAAKSDTYHTL